MESRANAPSAMMIARMIPPTSATRSIAAPQCLAARSHGLFLTRIRTSSHLDAATPLWPISHTVARGHDSVRAPLPPLTKHLPRLPLSDCSKPRGPCAERMGASGAAPTEGDSDEENCCLD